MTPALQTRLREILAEELKSAGLNPQCIDDSYYPGYKAAISAMSAAVKEFLSAPVSEEIVKSAYGAAVIVMSKRVKYVIEYARNVPRELTHKAEIKAALTAAREAQIKELGL